MDELSYVNALGAMSGGQAVNMVKGGLNAIYLSGWQVAGDANLAGEVYPDQSLYPANSAPALVRRINNALKRADQIAWMEGEDTRYLVPIVADGEAGFGGALNVFELTKKFIEAGAAGVHFRGSACFGEEVWTHGWQGAHPDGSAHPHADVRSSGRRCAWGSELHRVSDGLVGCHAADQRRGRSRQAVCGRGHQPRRVPLRAQRHGNRHRSCLGVRSVFRSHLVRDCQARPR